MINFNNKDVTILEFIHDRLLEVYGEKLNCDWMKKLREITKRIEKIEDLNKELYETKVKLQNIKNVVKKECGE